MTAVLPMRYEGNGMFRCLRPRQIDIQPGQVNGWTIAEHRSKKSHDHFFASIHRAWENLPEDLATDFPSPDHLRKWALIKAGYCTETRIVCEDDAQALSLVALAKAMDQFAIVQIDGNLVTIWRADSQRREAMDRARFKEAKDAALQIVSELAGTDVASLRDAA